MSLRTAPTLVIRSAGAPATTQCPGAAADPRAASGVLCVHLSSSTTLATTGDFPDGLRVLPFGGSGVNAFGAEMFIFSQAAGRFFADGTWAVTGN